jgi:regulatory protein
MGRGSRRISSEDAQDAVASADSMLPQEASPVLAQEPSPGIATKDVRAIVYNMVRKKAMDLLMRREHAVAELQKKLIAKDYDIDIVAEVVERLANEGLVSDERFTEAFVRYRRNNGYGPRRIQSELRERGVSEKIQSTYLDSGDPQWFEHAALVQSKRFGDSLPEDFKERARQARFLQYRGFTSDQIREVLDDS